MPFALAVILGLLLAFAPAEEVARESNVVKLADRAVSGTGTQAKTEVKSEAERRTARALDALYLSVPTLSHPAALLYAFEAYYNYRELDPAEVTKPYLYFVDFGLAATEPRGYVFDMDQLRIVEGPFTVAHGRGSVKSGEAVPTLFSNRPGSNATSLGLFVAAETYGFQGKSNGRAYRSVGLRMDGVSAGFNSAARQRGVVVHGAPYVTAGRAGRSEGCPAMEPERAERLLPMLSGGSLVFLFSPYDREWLRLEPWVAMDIARSVPEAKLAARTGLETAGASSD